jgi:hypothetical protein
MFDAVIMLKALTTVLEMTAPMLKKILPLTVEEHLRHKMRCCIASSTTSRLKDQHNAARLHCLLPLVSPRPQAEKRA